MGGIVGKVVGGICGAIPGLNKIAPFIQTAVCAFTGDWVGAAQGVASLVSRFAPGNSFLGKVGQVAGLATSFMGNGGVSGFKNLFSGRLSELAGNFKNVMSTAKLGLNALGKGNFLDAAQRITDAFKTAQTFVKDAQQVRQQIRDVYQLGNVFRG